MTAGRAHAGGEPDFVGRDAEMAAARAAAATRPGLIVVAGASSVGTTRFATELARALVQGGRTLVRLRSGGRLADRLSAALSAAELRPDPVTAARLTPFVALLGDIEPTNEELLALGATVAETDAILIACAEAAPPAATAISLEPLPDAAGRAIVNDAEPDLDETTVERLVEIAAGRPGILVPLVRANPQPVTEERPPHIPQPLIDAAFTGIAGMTASHIDLLRWTALLGTPFAAAQLVRVTGRTEDALAEAFDSLVSSRVLLADGNPPSYRFADALLREALRQAIPPTESRRRNLAVLNARRAAGEPPALLVVNAIGAADAGEVVALSIAASEACRAAGDAEAALVHADRAVAWSMRGRPETERLDALFQQGLSLGVTGNWEQAAWVLEDVIRRQRSSGREGGAIRAASEWARVRWYAGYPAEALELLRDAIRPSATALPERARALHQAAMFAAHDGRHDEADRWAQAARDEALASGEHAVAAQATNALGLAQVFSTASPEGLSHFRQGFEEAKRAGLGRLMAVTLNNESVSMLMLGMVRQAADRAQQGLDLAAAQGIGEVDAPLSQNLGEALAAMGRFPAARKAAVASRAAYEAMGSRALEPLDLLLAWIDFCEGQVPEALAALRQLVDDARSSAPLESLGPLYGTYAHVAHAAGEVDEARRAVTSGLAHRDGTHDRLDTLMLVAAAAVLLPPRDAAPLMAELADSAEAGAPLAIALVPYARGWTSSGGGDRVAAFRRAADAFTGTDCHWWSARSLMLAGEAAPGSEGVEDLLEARRRFREIDAPGWRSGCEAALRARGHRFVMASRHTDESDLSTREREVLAHVARGLTNREVAERLHISAKTAARHLERIYAKLSVSSRTAAVTAAVERGLIADIDVRTSTSSTTSPR